MKAYTNFAEVYDTFMDNVPYEEWAEYLLNGIRTIWDGRRTGTGTGMWDRNND